MKVGSKNKLLIVGLLIFSMLFGSSVGAEKIYNNKFKSENSGWKFDETRYYTNHVRVEGGKTDGSRGKYALLDRNRKQLTDYKYEVLLPINAKGHYNTRDNMCFIGIIEETSDEPEKYEILNNKGEVLVKDKTGKFLKEKAIFEKDEIPVYFTSKNEFIMTDFDEGEWVPSDLTSYGTITHYSYKDGKMNIYKSDLKSKFESKYQYTVDTVITAKHQLVNREYINKELNKNFSKVEFKYKKFAADEDVFSYTYLNTYFDELGNEQEIFFIGYNKKGFQETVGMIDRNGEIVSFEAEKIRDLDEMEIEKYGKYYILRNYFYPEGTSIAKVFDKNGKEYLKDLKLDEAVVSKNKYSVNGREYIHYTLVGIYRNKVYIIDNNLKVKNTVKLPEYNKDDEFILSYTPLGENLYIELYDTKELFYTGNSKLLQRHVYDKNLKKLTNKEIKKAETTSSHPISIRGLDSQEHSQGGGDYPYINYPEKIDGNVFVSAVETFYMMKFFPIIENNIMIGENPEGFRVELELKNGVDSIKAGKKDNMKTIKLESKVKKIENSYMIPVREVFEKLGYKVEYIHDEYQPWINIKGGSKNGK